MTPEQIAEIRKLMEQDREFWDNVLFHVKSVVWMIVFFGGFVLIAIFAE